MSEHVGFKGASSLNTHAGQRRQSEDYLWMSAFWRYNNMIHPCWTRETIWRLWMWQVRQSEDYEGLLDEDTITDNTLMLDKKDILKTIYEHLLAADTITWYTLAWQGRQSEDYLWETIWRLSMGDNLKIIYVRQSEDYLWMLEFGIKCCKDGSMREHI